MAKRRLAVLAPCRLLLVTVAWRIANARRVAISLYRCKHSRLLAADVLLSRRVQSLLITHDATATRLGRSLRTQAPAQLSHISMRL